MARILVTGAAGFIGFHLARRLLERGDEVVGLDNLNPYYDVRLKEARRSLLEEMDGFRFAHLDLADREGMERLFETEGFERVAHMAAQAGVRYSLENPHAYIDSNLVGFLNVLEGCRHHGVEHPFSLYAATKKSNELMAHSYSHLYELPTTGLRFFTVYGPWGRPDMALFLFTQAILAGEPIDVFNNGKMKRDFTYIGDIVEGVIRTLDRTPEANPQWSGEGPDPGSSYVMYKLYNIGSNNPVELLGMIRALEDALGMKAQKRMLPMQPGDVPATYADVDDLMRDVGFRPSTPLEEGIARFVEWYRGFYGE